MANGTYSAVLLERQPSPPAVLQDTGQDSSLVSTQHYSQEDGSQQIHQQSCSQLATQRYSQAVTADMLVDNKSILGGTVAAHGAVDADKGYVVATLSKRPVKA